VNLQQYMDKIKAIARKNKWSKTPNVTLLEAARKIIEATDKWRRCYPSREVVESIMESMFYLLATCQKIEGDDVNLDELFTQICKEKKNNFGFKEVPDDVIWSFIIYSSEPHVPYRMPKPLETATN